MKLLASHVAEDDFNRLQPFSVIEDFSFVRLVAELDPKFVLPSRCYLSDVISIPINNENYITIHK